MSVPEDHAHAVAASFAGQAAAFEDRRFIGGLATGADWMYRDLVVAAGDAVLDVAAGTGHAARRLAPSVARAVALDATTEMLAAGRAAAAADGLTNLEFVRGDATAMPFPDGSFDVVLSRFAAHHFPDPAALAAEMARCLRPTTGRVLIADLVTAGDPAVAERHHALEVARDPSHARCLTPDGLAALARAAELRVVSVIAHATRRPLGPWLEQTSTPAEVRARIETALGAELDGGPTTGLWPALAGDGTFTFEQRFAAVTALAG